MQIENTLQTPGFIYVITNSINGKCYIGQTAKTPEYRWTKYKNLNCKGQIKLYTALCKYGVNNFIFEYLDIVYHQKELNDMETQYIRVFDSMNNGYNCNEGGKAPNTMSNEIKQKISNTLKGHECSDATKQKMSISLKGRILTEEHKRRISENSPKHMLGKHHTDEAKQKISENLKTTLNTEEQKRKMSESHMGKIQTEESNRKRSETMIKLNRTGKNNPMYGRHASEETRRKMSESIKRAKSK